MKFIFYAHKKRQEILDDTARKKNTRCSLSLLRHQFKHLINVFNYYSFKDLVLVSIVVKGGTNVKRVDGMPYTMYKSIVHLLFCDTPFLTKSNVVSKIK